MSVNMSSVAVNITFKVDNAYVAKQLVDGVIWKANSMREWMTQRVRDDAEAFEKLVEQDADGARIEALASRIEQNEAAIAELGTVHKTLADYYFTTFGEKAPSTLPKEQKEGYGKGSAKERLLARMKAKA